MGSITGSEKLPGEGNGNPLSISAQRIPWTEEPGRLQSIGLQESDTAQRLNHHIPRKVDSRVLKRYLYTYVHSSVIHKNENVEAVNCPSTDDRISKMHQQYIHIMSPSPPPFLSLWLCSLQFIWFLNPPLPFSGYRRDKSFPLCLPVFKLLLKTPSGKAYEKGTVFFN